MKPNAFFMQHRATPREQIYDTKSTKRMCFAITTGKMECKDSF